MLEARCDSYAEPPAMLNPLRSEDEAFRLLLYVVAIFAVIIAGILIARAVL